jgi:hypothetical protein
MLSLRRELPLLLMQTGQGGVTVAIQAFVQESLH